MVRPLNRCKDTPDEWLCTDDYKDEWLRVINGWELGGADPAECKLARECICDGIPLEFETPRCSSSGPVRNTRSFIENEKLCEPKLLLWEKHGKIRKWAAGPYASESPVGFVPLHAVVKTDSTRTVIGAHVEINPALKPRPFRMSSVASAEALMQPGCMLYKLDVSDAFLSWRLHPEAQRHLAFTWRGEVWYFTCLPFGLKCAPFFCDLMMRVLCSTFVNLNVLYVQYCDDILLIRLLGMGDGLEHERVKASFRSLGVNNNIKKESAAWSTQVDFLGFTLDSEASVTLCTESRRLLLLEHIVALRKSGSILRDRLMTLTGRLVFVSHCFPASKPFYNSLFKLIHGFRSARKNPFLRLSMVAKDDLDIWILILSTWNGRRAWFPMPRQEVMITSDASFDGYGFFVSYAPLDLWERFPPHLLPGNACAAFYSPGEECTDLRGGINWGEMVAIVHAFVGIASVCRGQRVVFQTDNLSNVFALKSQRSVNGALNHLLRIIYFVAAQFNVDIASIHIAGVDNHFADWLSRPSDHLHALSHTYESQIYDIHHIFSSNLVFPTELHQALDKFNLTSLVRI